MNLRFQASYRIHLSSYRISLKHFELVDLDPAVFLGSLIVSFHSLQNSGAEIDKLLAATPELCVCENRIEYTSLHLESDFLEIALVVHSTISGPVGFSKLKIDPSVFSATLTAPLITETSTFVQPQISINLSCSFKARIEFAAMKLLVDDGARFGSVLPLSDRMKVKLELRLIEGFKVVESVATEPFSPSLIRNAYFVENQKLFMHRFLSRPELESLKAEIYLSCDDQTQLIDCISLKSLELDTPVLVGSNGQGQFVILSKEAETLNLCGNKHLLEFFKSKQYDKCCLRRFNIKIAGFDQGALSGSVRFGLKGFGFQPCFPASSFSKVSIDSDSVVFEMAVVDSDNSVPVLGIVVCDVSSKTLAIYSIPLQTKIHTFGTVAIQIERLIDENDRPFYLCPLMASPEKLTNKSVRLYCSIESLSKFPRELHSVFVTMRSVKMAVCPLMVPPSDVFSLQRDDDLDIPISSASTVTRSNTARPVWQHDVQVDIFQWSGDDWLYFLIYDNGRDGTELAGQACISLGLLDGGIKRNFTLPVCDGRREPNFLSDCFLNISFLKPLEVWCPIQITHCRSDQRGDHQGELRLTLNVLRDTDTHSVMKANHMWLPIKAVHPLIVYNCPPRGCLTLSMSRLNGSIVAETFHKYSMLETVLSCGGLHFNFSRLS